MVNSQIKFYSIPKWAKYIAQDGRSEHVSVVVSSTLKEVSR